MPVTGYIQLWLNKNSEFGYIQVMLMLMFQSQVVLNGLKGLDNNKEWLFKHLGDNGGFLAFINIKIK